MQALASQLLAQVLRVQIRLFACRERLLATTDDEALHDLRIALRQLRSLLRPLQSLSACRDLQQQAAALGRLTGPLRDLEVLQGHLREHGLAAAAQVRQPLVQQGYAELLASAQLAQLLVALDDWPSLWRQAGSRALRGLGQRISRRLGKDRQRLLLALADPGHDRHRLRLLVKRLRYAGEAYPQLAGLSTATQAALKQAQAALGTWHDHWQWLLCAETQGDLQPCVPRWQQALQLAEQRADNALQALLRSDLAERSS
ncbi:CHAD domain-containing protein [Pseudomonas sp.]|uniref:CHAD domain-containing protein n=1 Tax=Pseudomonas sp. TaxID=306 RepID=UPI003C75EE4A